MAEAALGIIGLIPPIVKCILTISDFFDSAQAAPRALRDFLRQVKRLEKRAKRFDDIIKRSMPPGFQLTAAQKEELGITEIEDILKEARDLLERWQLSSVDRGPLGNIVWHLRGNQKHLDRMGVSISKIYNEIFDQESLDAILNQVYDGQNEQRRHSINPIFDAATGDNTRIAAARLLPTSSPRRESTRTTIHGQTVVADADDEEVEVEWPEHWEDIPTTMTLKSSRVDAWHQTLTFHRFQVMFETKNGRILHFESQDRRTRAKHIIPYDSIPLTEKATPLKSHFLSGHVVIIIDDSGSEDESHHVYRDVSPAYTFDKTKSRRLFQSCARGRDLLGEFYAVQVKAGGHVGGGDGIVAKCQCLQLWSKIPPPLKRGRTEEVSAVTVTAVMATTPIVTMSVLASSLDDGLKHRELDLREYRRDALFQPAGILRRRTSSENIELLPSPGIGTPPELGWLAIRFPSKAGE
ncbi:hypothetical protein B0H66DRAFT_599050 [Apodospora peruviana]|uniref:Uncharacterized protein n=1 Tax=Apodospora peruviana TaxID=516989 RepID=A0AAE0MA02_9PEZI|nr:hypothetical protein B0H66DRAFT_599050 [Apodospora peruviana]